AQEIAPVVGELDDAHAKAAEDLDAVDVLAERRRVLEAVDDAEPAARLGAVEIGGRLHLHQKVGMGVDLALPESDALEGVRKDVRPAAHGADGEVDGRDTRSMKIGELRRGEGGIVRSGA